MSSYCSLVADYFYVVTYVHLHYEDAHRSLSQKQEDAQLSVFLYEVFVSVQPIVYRWQKHGAAGTLRILNPLQEIINVVSGVQL